MIKYSAILLFFIPLVLAHFGEEVENHSPMDIILDNPNALVIAAFLFIAIAFLLYTGLPIKKNYRKPALIISVLISCILIIAIFISLTREPEIPKPYHIHADFKVYLDDVPYNFSQAKYMSTNTSKLSQVVHLHDMDGDIIHYHSRNITLSQFFSTLSMSFNSSCFVLDNGSSYCNDDQKSLRMFVRHTGDNWEQINEPANYVSEDLDQILIIYGTADYDISIREASVTDKACIQSEKCPERGKPTDSSCAGDVCIV